MGVTCSCPLLGWHLESDGLCLCGQHDEVSLNNLYISKLRGLAIDGERCEFTNWVCWVENLII